MSTKVKGEKIKEGSIPLSALNDEVKNKIENAGGGADWNAKEGEAGYIENRPFERKNIEPIISNSEVVYNTPDMMDIYIQCYDSIYSFPFGYNDDGFFIKTEKEIYIPEDSVSIKAVRGYEYEMRVQSLNSELNINDIPSLITVFYVDRKLNQSDIDNTVIKITPQSLSDEDKNQALANLGIDPVVWKYMCEPIYLDAEVQPIKVPDAIHNVIWDSKNNWLRPGVLKFFVVGYDQIGGDCPTTFKNNRIYFGDTDWIYNATNKEFTPGEW